MENLRNEKEKPLKYSLYDINCNILSSNNIPIYFPFTFIFIKYVQLMGLTSTSSNPYLKFNFLQSCFQILILESQSNQFVTDYIFLCTFVNILILIFLLKNAFNETLKEWFSRFYYMWNIVFIVPNLSNFAQVFAEYKSFSIPIIVISLLGMMLQLIIYFNFEYFYFNFSIYTKDTFARNPKVPFVQILVCFSIVLTQILHTINNNSIYVLITIIHCISSFIILIKNCRQFNYHLQELNRLQGICTTIYFILNFCYSLIGLFPVQMISQNFLLLCLVVEGFGIRFYLNYRNNFFKITIIEDLENEKNEKSIDIFFRSYLKFFKENSLKKSQLYISSLLKIHINSCNDVDCSCKHREKLYDPKEQCFGNPNIQPHKDQVYFKHFLLKIMVQRTKAVKNSPLLSLNLGFYYLQVLKIYTKSIQILKNLKKKIKKHELDLPNEYLTYLFQKLIRKVIQQKNQSLCIRKLNIENIKTFDQKFNELTINVIQCASKFYEMWTQISINQKQELFIEKCTYNLKKILLIEKQYEFLTTLNANSSQFRHLMQIYSRYIIFDQHFYSIISKDIKQNYEMKQQKTLLNQFIQRKINIFSKKSFMIIISHQLSTFGNIIWASKNTKNILEINKEEILKTNINKIMPSVFGEFHNQIINHWHENGREGRINRMTNLWIINKYGHCSSSNVYVKIISKINNDDYQIMAYIQKINDQDYVIIDQDGQISCGGKQFFKHTKLNHQILKQNLINIQIFCPSFFKIFRPIYQQDKSDKTAEGIKKFNWYFSVPKNIEGILKNFGFKKQNIFSDYKINSAKKNYHSLENDKLDEFKQKYIIFLKNQISRMTQENDHHSFRMEFEIEKKKFYTGKTYKNYFSLKILNIKQDQTYYNNFLDQIQIQMVKLQEEITKLKNRKKEQQAKKAHNQLAIQNQKISKTMEIYKDVLKDYKKQKSKNKQKIRISNIERKKILFLTIKLLKEPLEGGKQKKLNKIKSEKPKIKNTKKIVPVNQINKSRVKKNIEKMKKALIREGILSIKMVEVFSLNDERDLFFEKKFSKTKTIRLQYQANSEEEQLIQLGKQSINENMTGDQSIQKVTYKQSVASNVTFISITAAIKSLKQELKKLRSPKALKIINILLIVVILVYFILMLIQNIIFRFTLDNFINNFKVSVDTNTLQQQFQLVMNDYQTLSLNSQNTNATQLENLSVFKVSQIKYFLNSIYYEFKKQTENQNVDSNPFVVFIYNFINLIIKNPLNEQFYLLQKYDCFKKMQTNLPKVIEMECYMKIKSDYGNFLKEWKQTLEVIHKNQIKIQDNLYNKEFILTITQIGVSLIFFIILLPLIYLVDKKMQETLKLFQKISKKDIEKYRLHFFKLKNYFERGLDYNKILVDLSQTNDQNSSTLHDSKTQSRMKNIKSTEYKFSIYYKPFFFVLVICVIISLKFIPSNVIWNKISLTQLNFDHFIQNTNQMIQNIYYFKYFFENQINPSENSLLSFHQNNIDRSIQNCYSSYITQDLKSELIKFASQNLCDVLNITNCLQQKLHNGALNNLIDFNTYLSYTKQQIIDMKRSFKKVISSQQYLRFQQAFSYTYKLIKHLEREMVKSQRANIEYLIKYKLYYSIALSLLFLILYVLVWFKIYQKISKQGSFISAFLLLIPYDLFKQNPYIKLHIRQEFNINGISYQ